jgi:hypothetical protein
MLPISAFFRIPRPHREIALLLVWGICMWVVPSTAAGAGAQKFVCDASGPVPVTFVKTSRGNLPLIRWVKKTFSGFGYDPVQRCRETSLRLTTFHNAGQLKTMRSGTTHGYPVLCVDGGVVGSACERQNVLLTFDRGVDPQAIGRQLTDLRARAQKGAISL